MIQHGFALARRFDALLATYGPAGALHGAFLQSPPRVFKAISIFGARGRLVPEEGKRGLSAVPGVPGRHPVG